MSEIWLDKIKAETPKAELVLIIAPIFPGFSIESAIKIVPLINVKSVSYTHLRAHET